MAHALIWSERAKADLFEILAYIDASAPAHANAVSERFEARTELCLTNPAKVAACPRTGPTVTSAKCSCIGGG